MERRHFITSAAAAVAALRAGDAWVAELLSRPPRERAIGDPEPPTETERALLAALAEALIPTTDTPGAIAAGVPQFILRLISEWMPPEDERAFRAGLGDLDAQVRAARGGGFAVQPVDVQLRYLQDWDAASIAARNAGQAQTFFTRLKTLALVGYYTSNVGQEQELHVRYGGGADQPGGPNCTAIPMRI
jgi:gluconate 2-dehydrogenase gamma chain